jgi:hypothetical protein
MSIAVTEAPRTPVRSRPRLSRQKRRSVGAVVLVSALLLLGLAGTWRESGGSMDEGIVLEYPQLILHGEVPFRDFQSSYGPGSYLPLAGAYQLFGPSVAVERSVGVAYRLAVVLAILALLWPVGARLGIAGASLAILAILPIGRALAPVAYGWFLALACLLWGLWSARTALVQTSGRRASGLWVLSGILAGFAASARPDVGVAALASSAVLLAAATARRRWAFALGLAAGASPLAWTLIAAGWSRFWSYGIVTRFHQLPLSGFPLPRGVYILAAVSAATLILVIAAIRERRRLGASAITRGWLALAVLSVLILPQVFQRADAGHLAFIAPVGFGMLPWALVRGSRSRLARIAIPGVCAIAIGLSAVVSSVNTGFVVRNDGRGFGEDSPSGAAALHRVLGWLDSNVAPGRRLFVGPADLRWAFYTPTELYYLAPHLRPAGFYLELGPGDDTPQFTSQLIRDLERADVLVLDRLPEPLFRQQVWPKARIGSSAPNATVTRDFRSVLHVGAYSIWVRRGPSSADHAAADTRAL